MVHDDTVSDARQDARANAPAPPRRQRKRAARSEQILVTAERLIAEQGLEALSLHAVARELDVVTGTLYRYFGSKDALVGALHTRIIGELHQLFRAELESHEAELAQLDAGPRSLAEVLIACELYIRLPRRLPEKFRFISRMLGDPRQLVSAEDVARSAPALMDFLMDIRERVTAAQDARALAPGSALDRTLVLWSALQGVLQLSKLERYDARLFDAARLAPQLVLPLLAGWGAAPAALEALSRRFLDPEPPREPPARDGTSISNRKGTQSC